MTGIFKGREGETQRKTMQCDTFEIPSWKTTKYDGAASRKYSNKIYIDSWAPQFSFLPRKMCCFTTKLYGFANQIYYFNNIAMYFTWKVIRLKRKVIHFDWPNNVYRVQDRCPPMILLWFSREILKGETKECFAETEDEMTKLRVDRDQ